MYASLGNALLLRMLGFTVASRWNPEPSQAVGRGWSRPKFWGRRFFREVTAVVDPSSSSIRSMSMLRVRHQINWMCTLPWSLPLLGIRSNVGKHYGLLSVFMKIVLGFLGAIPMKFVD